MGAQRRDRAPERLPRDVGAARSWGALRVAVMSAAIMAACTTADAPRWDETSSEAQSTTADTLSTNAQTAEKTSSSEGTGSTTTTSGTGGEAQTSTGVA